MLLKINVYIMSCKDGGFVTLRHYKLRGITGALLEEICHDVSLDQYCRQHQIVFFVHQQQTQTMVADQMLVHETSGSRVRK